MLQPTLEILQATVAWACILQFTLPLWLMLQPTSALYVSYLQPSLTISLILQPTFILTFTLQPSLRSVVVGSNTQNVLQVFTFTKEGPGGDLVKSAEIVSPCLFIYCTVLAPCLMVFYPKTAVQVCLRYTYVCQKDILLCIIVQKIITISYNAQFIIRKWPISSLWQTSNPKIRIALLPSKCMCIRNFLLLDKKLPCKWEHFFIYFIFTYYFGFHQQHMDKLERPKGIGLIPKGVAIGYKGVLIAAGAKKSNDSTFLPSSSGSNMDVKIKFYSIDVGKILQYVCKKKLLTMWKFLWGGGTVYSS